jgi:hypothetical protein
MLTCLSTLSRCLTFSSLRLATIHGTRHISLDPICFLRDFGSFFLYIPSSMACESKEEQMGVFAPCYMLTMYSR